MAALVIVGAFTGLRCPGELRALRWAQVDFQNRIVHVVENYVLGQEGVTKGKRVRSVPLSDHALVALDRLSRRARHPRCPHRSADGRAGVDRAPGQPSGYRTERI